MTISHDDLRALREIGVKSFECDGVKVEFFEPKPEPMKLDPVTLSKTLTDTMPPDSAMLFASTEDVALELDEQLTTQQRETPDMR